MFIHSPTLSLHYEFLPMEITDCSMCWGSGPGIGKNHTVPVKWIIFYGKTRISK